MDGRDGVQSCLTRDTTSCGHTAEVWAEQFSRTLCKPLSSPHWLCPYPWELWVSVSPWDENQAGWAEQCKRVLRTARVGAATEEEDAQGLKARDRKPGTWNRLGECMRSRASPKPQDEDRQHV